MKWGLIYNHNLEKAFLRAERICDFLKGKGEVFTEESYAKKKGIEGYSLEDINKNADVVITIGRDGTILRALEKIDKPIFAINSGGMGFLTESDPENAIDGLNRIIDRKFNVEERAKLMKLQFKPLKLLK
jgi:NAD+ kinase